LQELKLIQGLEEDNTHMMLTMLAQHFGTKLYAAELSFAAPTLIVQGGDMLKNPSVYIVCGNE
jgi:hypothetical protein